MPPAQWTNEFLTQMRAVGDEPADALVAALFKQGEVGQVNDFMRTLVGNDDLPDDLPAPLAAFLAQSSQLPPWADVVRIGRAEDVFTDHGLLSLASLICASLPECYTMATGVKILHLTNQLYKHPNRRLHQTACMVLAVMFHGGLTPTGKGIRQTQKVRLIHAAIRYLILLDRPQQALTDDARATADSVGEVVQFLDWQVPRDGYPINQEDMAFTLLTFGYVIPRGLITLGVPLTITEREDFLHIWNVVGHLMGLRDDLLAHTVDDAEFLFSRIKALEGRASLAGQELTSSLLEVAAALLPIRILKALPPMLLRILVGDETADMLDVEFRNRVPFRRVLLRVFATAAGGLDRVGRLLFAHFSVTAAMARWVGRRLIINLYTSTEQGHRARLEIPDDLKARWNLEAVADAAPPGPPGAA